ncbi:MAG TPA: chromate transporter [Candidatus Polarisedimenticolia bacterium]|jgi:chromate transporter
MDLPSEQHGDETVAPRPLPPEEREPWGSFLRSMFRVGVNTFGGPVAQIGVMHKEAVETLRWVADAQFVHLLDFANILPGPEALEIAIHLGYLRRGVRGGIVAGLLFILPGFVSLTALAWMYHRYGQVPAVTAFLDGIRPIALALIATAAVRLSGRSLKVGLSYLLMGTAFVASFLMRAPFVVVLGSSGLLGLLLAHHRKSANESKTHGWALTALVILLIVGNQLWPRTSGKPAEGLPGRETTNLSGGPEVTVTRLGQIAWVNTKAALLTFGGAYTVLPVLREQTIGRYGWLTDRQVIDALALGETTPGPLISIGVFLSYLAGGFPGAAVGCVFLFLPSFLFVLGLARYVEKVENLPYAR